MNAWWGVRATALAAMLASSIARAEDVRDIDWGALQSPQEIELRQQLQELKVQMLALPREQQNALPRIGQAAELQRQLDQGKLTPDKLLPSQRELVEEKLAERYPDVANYWSKTVAIKQKLTTLTNSTNATLNGARVRLSGYLLPLEVDGGEVSEFLLVPYVGACIHVPPPPPNQIVHVAMQGRYAAEALYAPVTVTGRLSSSPGQVDLFLEDGSAMIDRGYRLDAETVKPAKSG